MITTPEIICDLLSFLDKDQIERIQLVNQFCNNVIIRHKNILPLRQFAYLTFIHNQINLYERPKGNFPGMSLIYSIRFEWKDLKVVCKQLKFEVPPEQEFSF